MLLLLLPFSSPSPSEWSAGDEGGDSLVRRLRALVVCAAVGATKGEGDVREAGEVGIGSEEDVGVEEEAEAEEEGVIEEDEMEEAETGEEKVL